MLPTETHYTSKAIAVDFSTYSVFGIRYLVSCLDDLASCTAFGITFAAFRLAYGFRLLVDGGIKRKGLQR